MPSVIRLARDLAAKIWPVVTARSRQGRQWLMTSRDPITWATVRARLTALPLLPNTNAGRLAALAGVVVLLLLVLPWYAKGHKDKNGVVSYPNAALLNPILAGIGASLLIYAAIRQAQTATNRHREQTRADQQRRVTESFSKAAEQLSSEKIEARLGGIYTLERLAHEDLSTVKKGNGLDLYWTVMETLTAFVRERAKWQEPKTTTAEMASKSDYLWGVAAQSNAAPPRIKPATDIAAVLEVIRRRPQAGRDREQQQRAWILNLSATDLRGADRERFGRLTVLAEAPTRANRARYVQVRCNCGVMKETSWSNVFRGVVVSCGCAKRQHNMVGHPAYETWRSMRAALRSNLRAVADQL